MDEKETRTLNPPERVKKRQIFVREKRGDKWCSVDLLDPQECSDEKFREEIVNKVIEI